MMTREERHKVSNLSHNAVGVLLGGKYESFTRGSDELVAAGVQDDDGQPLIPEAESYWRAVLATR